MDARAKVDSGMTIPDLTVSPVPESFRTEQRKADESHELSL